MYKKYLNRLFEAKQVGTLYHFTTIPRLLSILYENQLTGHPSISFTRLKKFTFVPRMGIGTEVRIYIDGDKLSNKYKISPFQYQFSKKEIKDTNLLTTDELEERVKGPIKNIKDYILGIDIQKIKNLKLSDLHWYAKYLIKIERRTEFVRYLSNVDDELPFRMIDGDVVSLEKISEKLNTIIPYIIKKQINKPIHIVDKL